MPSAASGATPHRPDGAAPHRPDGAAPHRPDGATPHRPDGVRQFEVVVIVTPSPNAIQAKVLVDLPDRPLVERRTRQGIGRIQFHRDGPDLATAVTSVLADVESVGLRPVRLVDDDWVTLGDIADRVGRSRETVRLWSLGRCGPGSFPPPLNPGRDTSFYSWVEVAHWLRTRLRMKVTVPDPALVAANLTLQMRLLGERGASRAAGLPGR